MRRIVAGLTLVALVGFLATRSLATAAPPGWESNLDRARTRALREHKPILLLQMFGRLDEEFC